VSERIAAYRRWQQKIRGRASRRLIAAHPDEWRRLLAEEQAAEPWQPT
jgi:hypothetical protein